MRGLSVACRAREGCPTNPAWESPLRRLRSGEDLSKACNSTCSLCTEHRYLGGKTTDYVSWARVMAAGALGAPHGRGCG